MTRKKIRSTSTFSLSFLDIMSCGLGAAVLIFLLLKHVTENPINTVEPETTAEINLLEEEIQLGEETLVRIRNTISEITDETVTAQGLARRIEEEIKELKSLLEEIAPDSEVDIDGLKNKIARLQKQKRSIENTVLTGNKAYEFVGEGERQYLTGVKLGGANVLILVDSSASMLDETIVNVIRRRNMSDEQKLRAPKWERAQNITQWIVANLPINSDFQVLSFNEDVSPVIGDNINQWYPVTDRLSVASAVDGVKALVPENGTNMHRVFDTAMRMKPMPDNIFLITDGLPTQGGKAPKSGTISGAQRLRTFWSATQSLYKNRIPVNTFLLPMEGDPYAAGAFWRLAVVTRGAIVAPARDWP